MYEKPVDMESRRVQLVYPANSFCKIFISTPKGGSATQPVTSCAVISGSDGHLGISGSAGHQIISGSTGHLVTSGSTGHPIISGSAGHIRFGWTSDNILLGWTSGNIRIGCISSDIRLSWTSGDFRLSECQLVSGSAGHPVSVNPDLLALISFRADTKKNRIRWNILYCTLRI